MQEIQDILDDKYFENLLISKDNIAQFEDIALLGHLDFINECTVELKKTMCSNSDLIQLSYLFKYIFNNWLLSDKATRANKRICYRVIFLMVFLGSITNDRTLILEKTIEQVESSWLLTRKDFPFLFQEEKEKISSQISIITGENSYLKKLPAIKLDDHLNSKSYPFILPEIAKKLNALYFKFYHASEKIKDKDEKNIFVESVFTGILENKLTLDFPGILVSLPLFYLCRELEKVLTSMIPSTGLQNSQALSSFKITNSYYPKEKLFVKEDNGDLQPLPYWAVWFCEAGAKVAAISQNNQNLVVGFSLPTRAYAALFFLVGYESWMAKNKQKETLSYKEYFDSLSESEPEAPLLLWDGGRWKRCFFQNIETVNTCRMIKVKVQGTEKNMHLRYVPEDQIYKIRPAVDPKRKVGRRQLGFSMKGHDFLMKYFSLSDLDLIKSLICSDTESLILGQKATIQKQIQEVQLFCEGDEGTIQDLVRIKNFMSEFTFPKSEILSSQKSIAKYSRSPTLLLFDGSNNFLKNQGRINSPVEIIFLDRTENNFASAADELMNRYYNRESELSLFDEPPLPIEIAAFTE